MFQYHFNTEQAAVIEQARAYLERMPPNTQFAQIVAGLLQVTGELANEVSAYEERATFACKQECWSHDLVYQYITQHLAAWADDPFTDCE